MKKVAIISRALQMNGATKALVEMLKRIDYSMIEIDLWVLDFSELAEEWVSQIPDKVVIKKIPRYDIGVISEGGVKISNSFCKGGYSWI